MRIEDVAERADVSAAHLSRVENGTTQPRPRWVSAVAHAIAGELAQQQPLQEEGAA